MDQEEITCHAVGERRQNYLNQIRCILEQMDDTPCVRKAGNSRKPLIEYPGVVNRKRAACRKNMGYTPMIVNVPVQELRPTSEYWKHAHENDEKLQYYSVFGTKERKEHQPTGLSQRKKSFELLGSHMITGCDCGRRNGLQDKCQRTECQHNQSCRNQPPTCAPYSTYPVSSGISLEEKFQKAIEDNKAVKKNYCCCDHDERGMDPRSLPQGFNAFPCKDH